MERPSESFLNGERREAATSTVRPAQVAGEGAGLQLPQLTCTEDAVRYGQHITRDQFIFLSGAREAIGREFELIGRRAQNVGPVRASECGQARMFMALQLQLIREALEVAPDRVLASLIGTGLGIDSQPSTLNQPHFQMAGSGV